VTFVRTVLGDIEPDDLGPTDAHEHLAIGPGGIVDQHPDMLLDDVDRTVAELEPARALGLGGVVDALPSGGGRQILQLTEISRRSGIHVVASTGLHLARYYAADHWSTAGSPGAIAGHFSADVLEGIDEHDDVGPAVSRTAHRAGVIKIAGSAPDLTERDRRVFEAAAATHRATGCPILTHCSDGVGGLEQLRFLAEHGVEPGHVALSHVDKVVDRGYHRELVATGAFVEYDQAFRWPDGRDNGTLTLLTWMLEDDCGDRVLLGLDAARQGYWTTYGGTPGLAYLLGGFGDAMRERGIGDAAQTAVFVTNPARAFAFAVTPRATDGPAG
jgi:phosphotriesterase-related protein